MSEADLLESSANYMGLSLDVLSLYMTITSGYLIVAYLAGSKLTSLQITIVSTLYVFMGVVCTYGLFGLLSRATQLSTQHAAMSGNLTTYASSVIPLVLSATMAGGIVASLVFMWNTRKHAATRVSSR